MALDQKIKLDLSVPMRHTKPFLNTLMRHFIMQNNKSKIVVLSGAGVSAESGLKTFRDSEDGLWNNYKIEDVCTALAFEKNPTLVNDFYNFRRIEMLNATPNAAHDALACLENRSDVDIHIITTNIDDLHERAGSINVLHLHGLNTKARSSNNAIKSLNDYLLEKHLTDVGREGIKNYQEADDGFLLRPHVVFFGEEVPNLGNASEIIREADHLIVVGTSLSVYPAASLIYSKPPHCKIYYVDPNAYDYATSTDVCIAEKATTGIPKAIELILGEIT